MALSTQRASLAINAQGPVRTSVNPSFPLEAHGSGRYLVDQNGVPFPVLGRVYWMISWLEPADYLAALDDAVEKGFNAIECKPPLAPEGFQYDNGGEGNGGVLPFEDSLDGTPWEGQVIPYADIDNDAPDFTTPNEAFWEGVDDFFAACLERHLLVFWFPAYVGFHNTDWWMEMMVANGPTKMQTYGAWVATRYQNQANLVWMIGGDKGTGEHPFSSEEAAVEEAFIAGLKSVATVSSLYSAEWVRGSITTDLYPEAITLNGCYSAALDINNQGARAWAYTPTLPAYFQEFPFETSGSPSSDNRRNTIWAWLSSGGYLYGVNALFEEPDVLSDLDTPGVLDCARLNVFVKSLEWQKLRPANSVVTAGGGTANQADEVAAMRAHDGSMIVAYCPTAHSGTVTIDMTQMRGPTLSRWWDPTSGFFTADASGIAASGTREFTKPGNNAAGDDDWLLVLTA